MLVGIGAKTLFNSSHQRFLFVVLLISDVRWVRINIRIFETERRAELAPLQAMKCGNGDIAVVCLIDAIVGKDLSVSRTMQAVGNLHWARAVRQVRAQTPVGEIIDDFRVLHARGVGCLQRLHLVGVLLGVEARDLNHLLGLQS